MGECRLGEHGDGSVELGKSIDLVDGLDACDGMRCDGHRADGLLVTLMTDVDDVEAFSGARLHLVMHLGDEGAHRIDHVTAALAGCGNDLRCRSVRREHDRGPDRNLVDRVNEDDALFHETIDDDLVVHDLVVAVHGFVEGAHHPCERLDGHLDTGAETPRRRKQHLVNSHRATSIERQQPRVACDR